MVDRSGRSGQEGKTSAELSTELKGGISFLRQSEPSHALGITQENVRDDI